MLTLPELALQHITNIERYNMEYATKELERIANAIEEILRLVKKDMENINKAAKE